MSFRKPLVDLACALIPSRRLRHELRQHFNYTKKTDAHYLKAIKDILRVNFDITQVPPAHGNLRNVQLASAKLLVAVTRLCEENGINVFLHGGTLLGAVRHKGFVPWDDDTDTGMMRADFEKFMALAETFLPSAEFSLTVHPSNILQVTHTASSLYIDIFPFDTWHKKAETPQDIRDLKYAIWEFRAKAKHVSSKGLRPSEYFARLTPLFNQRLMNGRPPAADGAIFKYGGRNDILGSDWVLPAIPLPFEGRTVPGMREPGLALTAMYGDYYDYPFDILSKHKNWTARMRSDQLRAVDGLLSLSDDQVFNLLLGRA
jgi:lipopolysaccharide cholinephosphotransferase